MINSGQIWLLLVKNIYFNIYFYNLAPVVDQQPITSTPLRRPNTLPKILSFGKGRGNFPVANWTSLAKGCGCRFNGHDTPQTPPVQQELGKILAVVAPTDKVQTYKGNLVPGKNRKHLANWTWVRLGDTMLD